MSKKKVVVKKRGFSIVSLLIGLLLGIIIVVGAIGGVVAYLLLGDIDSILSMFGLENQDEDGNYVYVNTSEESGVSNVMDLISWVADLGDIMDLSVAEISAKLPVVETYVDTVYDMAATYVDLDKAEVYALPFNQFTDYISDKLLDVQIGALLDTMGAGENSAFASNVIVRAMIYGINAQYVYIYNENGTLEHRYPVWYDEYYLWDTAAGESGAKADTISIATGSTAEELDLGSNTNLRLINTLSGLELSSEDIAKYSEYLTLNADGYYRIYYCGFPDTDEDGSYLETTYYVTYKDPDTAEFVWMDPSLEYTTSTPTLHGNYYFDEDGNDYEANPITIRKLTQNPYENLYEIYITDLYENNTEDLGFIADVLGTVSLAELINGEVDFAELVNNLELSSIMTVSYDPNSVSSAESILLYLLYGVSGMTETGTENVYAGTYRTVTGDNETGYSNGATVPCYIKTDSDGNILGVYIQDEDGSWVEASGTTINQVDVRMNGLMDDLTISQIVDVSAMNNPIIDMIKDSTINGFASDINHMTMNQLFCNDIYGKTDPDNPDSLVASLYEVVDENSVTDEDTQIAFNSDYTYYIEGNSGILIPVGEGYSVSSDGSVTYGNGHYDSYSDLTAAMGDTTVYTYGQARALWKLLIYHTVTETNDDGTTSTKKDDSGHAVMYEVAYLVSDMNNMYYNIQYNVQNASLETLQEALMLDISDDFLNSYLYTVSGTTVSQSDKQVKDMTLIELLNYIQENFTYTQVETP